MFIIPIGHEDSRTRRFPAASLAIVAAWVIAFGLSWPKCQEEQKRLEQSVSSAFLELQVLIHDDKDPDGELAKAMVEAVHASSPEDLLKTIETALAKSEREDEELAPLRASLDRIRQVTKDRVFFHYGLVPSRPTFIGLLAHMFLHGGWLHLIFNLLFFILVGPALEDLWGRALYPALYLLFGILSGVGFMLVSGPIGIPLIGASGAIAGLMGAFLVSFTHTRIKMLGVLFFLIHFKVFTFSAPAWVFLPLWIGFELLQGFQQLGAGVAAGVAHWAHIVGFFAGVVTAVGFKVTRLDRKLFHSDAAGSTGEERQPADPRERYRLDPSRKEAVEHFTGREFVAAQAAYLELSERYPDLPEPKLELAEMHRARGHRDARLAALRDAVAIAVRTGDPRAIEIAEAIRSEGPGAPLPPDVLTRLSVVYAKAERLGRAADCLKEAAKAQEGQPGRVKTLLRLADLFRGPLDDPESARDILVPLRDEAGKDMVLRDQIESRLREIEKSRTGKIVAVEQPK